MSGIIFISYRRGDGGGSAGRLYDRLEQEFRPERLFFDVYAIDPGQDFVQVLQDKVDSCDVFLAVIGRTWLDIRNDAGQRRLDTADDFVRIEVERALSAGKRVIPVLVDGAQMPPADTLPDSLKPLTRRHAVRLQHETFKADCDRLAQALQTVLVDIESKRQADTEEEARAEAAERERQSQLREAAEAVARRHAEEEARARAEAAERLAQQKRALASDGAEVTARERTEEPGRTGAETEELDRQAREREAAGLDKQRNPKPEVGDKIEVVERLPVDEERRPLRESEEVVAPPKAESVNERWPREVASPTPAKLSRRRLVMGATALGAGGALVVWYAVSRRGIEIKEAVTLANGSPVLDADIHHLGGLAATGSSDGSVRVWSPKTGEVLAEAMSAAFVGRVSYLQKEGTFELLTASADRTRRIWTGEQRLDSPKILSSLGEKGDVPDPTSASFVAAWSPDGKWIITGDGINAHLWDTGEAKMVKEMRGHTGDITFAAFAPNGSYILTTATDKTAIVWRLDKSAANTLHDHTGDVVAADISGGGSHFATASLDHTVRIYGIQGETLVQTHLLRHDHPVRRVRFGPPKGDQIVTVSYDNTARLWMTATGSVIAHPSAAS